MSDLDDDWHQCHLKRCENSLVISGAAPELERFKRFVETPDSPFDFDAVVPYPDAYKQIEQKYQEWAALPFAERQRTSGPDTSGGDLWRMDHWGTSWIGKVERTFSSDALCYDFLSLYTPPFCLMFHASAAFPELRFFLSSDLIEHDLTVEYVFQCGRVESEEWMSTYTEEPIKIDDLHPYIKLSCSTK
jgi:hypothetical protein